MNRFFYRVACSALLALICVLASCTAAISDYGVATATGVILHDDPDHKLDWQSQGVKLGQTLKGNQDPIRIVGDCGAGTNTITVAINSQTVATTNCVGGSFSVLINGFAVSTNPVTYTLVFKSDAANATPVSVTYDFLKLTPDQMLWNLNTGPASSVVTSSETITAQCRPGVQIVLNGSSSTCPGDGNFSLPISLPKYGPSNPNNFSLVWKDDYGNGNESAPHLFSVYRNTPGAPHIVADQHGAMSPAGMVSFISSGTYTATSNAVTVKSAAGLGTNVGTNHTPPLSILYVPTGVTLTIGR